MLHYILQTIAFQLFFLLIYDLFLKRETFFNWNRTYLLMTSVLSFILPFIKIKALQESIPQDYIIKLPEIVISDGNNALAETVMLDTIVITNASVSYIQWFFYVGLSVSLCLFVFKLYKILSLIKRHPKTTDQGFYIVNLMKSKSAFSFLNYIFIGDVISQDEIKHIIDHEKVHVKQKHTLDLLYFELLKICFWFNPLVYIYQNRISELHEFIADAKALKTQCKANYYQNLLSQIFDTHKVSFINTFFKQSLIKKRIVMLSKQKSKAILKLKYALLIPLVFGMLIYTSCTQDAVAQSEPSSTNLQSASTMDLINALKEKIMENGELTEQEEKSLKVLLLTQNNFDENYEELKEFIEIPYTMIDQVPIFPGCEGLSKEQQRKCMTEKITEHIINNFNTKLGNDRNFSGTQKIMTSFIITNTGEVREVKARAAHTALENEAKRVIQKLPKMIPGKQKGKAVNVPYSLPIVFEISS